MFKHIGGIGDITVTEHKSGAKIICIDNDDNNCVFSLCFDTPAEDDTGIPHILEHCVLCGSEKYPYKDAFNILEQNTVHTYLNAITYPHRTLFPAASTDENSLLIMADVYCDCVFHPLVYKNKGIFLQGGGFFDGERIQGSVYGEMSGEYEDGLFGEEQYLKKQFTHFLSAGTPEMIPFADYGKLLEYHKKYYTPANCTAFIYGKCDKQKYIDILDRYFALGTEKPKLKKPVLPDKIFVGSKLSLVPVCLTSETAKLHAYHIICDALGEKLNDDGEVAYIKLDIFDSRTDNISFFDIDSRKLYLKSGDFGYKPRGIFYNTLLMQSDFDIDALDFDEIFKKVGRMRPHDMLAKAFSSDIGKYEYVDIPSPFMQTPDISDSTPLTKYRAQKELPCRFIIPDLKADKPIMIFGHNSVFTDNKNKDIINITLAFELNLPLKMLKDTSSLLLQKHPAVKTGLNDIGKPCLTLQTSFFVKKPPDINDIFGKKGGKSCDLPKTEHLAKLTALSALEESALALKTIYDSCEEAYDIRKVLFTRKNLYYAVCTDKRNFKAAEEFVNSLVLHPDNDFKRDFFIPQKAKNIVYTNKNTSTISLAFASSAGYDENFAMAVILQNTYLWENVRCKGAYGCDCEATPSGNIVITSFKDINFDTTIETIKKSFEYLQSIKEEDMHKYKIMCYNALLRAQLPMNINLNALKMLCGQPYPDIFALTADRIKKAAEKTEFYSLAAYKKN